MNYWLITISYDNFKYIKEVLNFKFLAFSKRYTETVKNMTQNDFGVYYIKGIHKIGAIVKVSGEYFEDHIKVWNISEGLLPIRRFSKPEIVLDYDKFLDIKSIITELSFIKKKELWGSYFQGSLRKLPAIDYLLIRNRLLGQNS